MIRKHRMILLSSLALFSAVAATTAAVAWFTSTISFKSGDIYGKTAGAYFYSGDGSAEKPYTIKYPRNLYNLAWLQDMGEFNKTDENGDVIQVYFKLHDSLKSTGLNMGGWTIPPIGTEQYPFLGQFIGNDVIISNFTISNDFEDYGSNHPSKISSFGNNDGDVNQPEIVGLFGVVGDIDGDYSYDSEVNTISDFGADSFTVKSNTSKTLVGLAAGYVNGEVSNVAVNNGSVNIAYNGAQAVDSTKFTTNLSDYSIVGFCEKEYKASVMHSNNSVYGVDVSQKEFPADDTGEGTPGGGGTLNMTNIYNRCLSVYNTKTNVDQTIRTSTLYETDGITIKTGPTATYTAPTAARFYHSDNYETGNYAFSVRTDTTDYLQMAGGHFDHSTFVDEYYHHEGYPIAYGNNYLHYDGTKLTNITDRDAATLWSYSVGNNTYITTKWNDQTIYLSNVNGVLTTGTSTRWNVTIDDTEHVMRIMNGDYMVYFENSKWGLVYITEGLTKDRAISSNGFFLNNNNGNIGSAAQLNNTVTEWEITDNKVKVKGGNYYLVASKGQGSPTLSLTNNANNNNMLYFNIFDNNTGLLRTNYDADVTEGCNTTTHHFYYYVIYNNGWAISVVDRTNNTAPTAPTNAAVMKLETVESNTDLSITEREAESDSRDGPDYGIDDSRTTDRMVYSADDTTYIPLTVVADGTQSDLTKYYPSATNTGYIVSGSNYSSSYTYDSSNSGRNKTGAATNIRISRYAISNVSDSYTGGAITKTNDTYDILTIDGSGNCVKASDTLYENFSTNAGKAETEALDTSASYVHGLHFVSALIDKTALVRAPYALLNNRTTPYSNYELPANSINFNLVEKGNINFFSGMFYGGNTVDGKQNDSFFSLHYVQRDSDKKILDIKEIAAVYSDGIEAHSYSYKFTDGTYSRPFQFGNGGRKLDLQGNEYVETINLASLPTTYYNPVEHTSNNPCSFDMVFDTRRITNHERNASGHSISTLYCSTVNYGEDITIGSKSFNVEKSIFYFEIPMNQGEYCLGSVENGTGGYLFYLDIGANAKKIDRTEFREHFLFIDEINEYPKGTAVATFTKGSKVTVNDGDGACAIIKPSYNSTLTFVNSGGDVFITAGYDSTYIKGNYKNPESDFKSGAPPGNADITVSAKTVQTDIRQIEYFDYDPATQGYTRTVVTRTVIKEDNVQKSDITVYKQYEQETLIYDSSSKDLTDKSVTTFYDGSTHKKIDLTTLTPPGEGTDTEIVIVTFSYSSSGDPPESTVVELVADRIGSSTFYTGTRFTVTITIEGNDLDNLEATLKGGLSEDYSGITVPIAISGHYVIVIEGMNRQG